VHDADRVARLIGAENARRVYRLDDAEAPGKGERARRPGAAAKVTA
jgi:hypothetical protein